MHPNTLPPPSKDKVNIDNPSIFPHDKNNVLRQQKVPCLNPQGHPRPSTLMNKLFRTCTTCGECLCIYVKWRQKQLYSVHICTCTGAQVTSLMHTTLAAKNAHTPVQACLCDGAATSLSWNPLQSWILSSAQETITTKILASSWRGRGCVDSDAQVWSHQSSWCGTYPASLSWWLALSLGLALPGRGPDPSQISIFFF